MTLYYSAKLQLVWMKSWLHVLSIISQSLRVESLFTDFFETSFFFLFFRFQILSAWNVQVFLNFFKVGFRTSLNPLKFFLSQFSGCLFVVLPFWNIFEFLSCFSVFIRSLFKFSSSLNFPTFSFKMNPKWITCKVFNCLINFAKVILT